MAQHVKTPFKILVIKTLMIVWQKKIAIRYWCRTCNKKHDDIIRYGEKYPKFSCSACGGNNIIDLKYE